MYKYWMYFNELFLLKKGFESCHQVMATSLVCTVLRLIDSQKILHYIRLDNRFAFHYVWKILKKVNLSSLLKGWTRSLSYNILLKCLQYTEMFKTTLFILILTYPLPDEHNGKLDLLNKLAVRYLKYRIEINEDPWMFFVAVQWTIWWY